MGLDIGIFIFSFLVWKYWLWVPIEKLTIPNASQPGTRVLIDRRTGVCRIIWLVRAILR